jgi:hypothetical protein
VVGERWTEREEGLDTTMADMAWARGDDGADATTRFTLPIGENIGGGMVTDVDCS